MFTQSVPFWNENGGIEPKAEGNKPFQINVNYMLIFVWQKGKVRFRQSKWKRGNHCVSYLPCPPRPIIKWIRQIHMRNKRNIYQRQQMVKIIISTSPCNERIEMYVSYHCCPVEVHLLHLQSKYKNGLNGWQVPVILHLDTSCYQIFIASFLRNVVKKILQSLRCIRLGWKCIHIHLRGFFFDWVAFFSID